MSITGHSEAQLGEQFPRSPARSSRWRRPAGSGAGAVLLGAALLCMAAAADLQAGALLVTGVAFEEGPGDGGAALAELLRAALAVRGLVARAVPPPAACSAAHAPDAPECLRAVLAALARGALHAAVLPASGDALPAAPRLRDAGLESWGPLEQGGGGRRGCWARGPLRSLAELADPATARHYALAAGEAAALTSAPRYFCTGEELEPRPRACPGGEAAVAVVGPDAEARVLLRAARRAGLHLQALALGGRGRGGGRLACGRALAPGAEAHALGPPPCLARGECAFEARPLVKLGNARSLALVGGAARALDRLSLPAGGARVLAAQAAARGPVAAALDALARGAGGRGADEVRVVVMVPGGGEHASALRAAAELAEQDEQTEGGQGEGQGEVQGEGEVRYKVELVGAGCAAPLAFKYLTDALGAEFHALAAVVGPACAGPFATVARQTAALALPQLAYTPQEPAPGALLAAGSARARPPALAALLAALGWRRVALLTEPGEGGARLGVELVLRVELPDEEPSVDLLDQWAHEAAAASARVLVLDVQEARAARAALCACQRRGLTPALGAAFVVARALPAGWLHGAVPAPCDLRLQAEGMLRLQPEWAARWDAAPDATWTERWRARVPPASTLPPPPPADAALLYDVVRLWARTVRRLLRAHPEAVDDLHRADRVESLMQDVIRIPYTGLTGVFRWNGTARDEALLIQQWHAGGDWTRVGRWTRGMLALDRDGLRWSTASGRLPDDGAESCAHRPLAVECRAAAGAVLALALAALLGVLAGGAWHCRRRAAREHRARVAAFGMRALGPRGGAADRWELPRERVVINRRLGAGAFGCVYGGHALLGGGRGWVAVAVKTLRADASTEEKLDFLSEAEAMKRFSHPRLVRLLGVVTCTPPVCTVMEYMLHGDLKGYLVARRHLAGLTRDTGPSRLTRMACDAARALAYLTRLRYVHRDVAARNCLVDATLRVKLADFGMTRVVFDSEYYRFGRRGMLPVRWMAPESLALGEFSPASDVWSFGVLVYEIVTFGALPYRGLCNAEVLELAKAGVAPPLPALEPQLETLIRSCWRVSRRARPTAAMLAELLAQRPRLLAPSLAPPDALDEPLSTRNEPGPLESHWEACAWGATTSAGTDVTELSALPTDVTELSALPTDVTELSALSTDVTELSALPTDVTELSALPTDFITELSVLSEPFDTEPFLPQH